MRFFIQAALHKLKARGIALAAVTALALSGCGGGGSDSIAGGAAASVTGQFVDAPVAGLGYKCGASLALSGTTDANGYYTCKVGEAVGFYVGDILLGSVSSAQSVITPLDLVGAGAKPTDIAVSNIVRFLLSISTTDSAGNLVIDANASSLASGKTVDFKTIGASALDAMITTVKPGATPATQTAAENHMRESIYKLFAKTYAGTYGGSGSGTWSLTISATDGSVTGTYTDTENGSGSVAGQMSTDMSVSSTYGFTGTAGSSTWTGTLNVSTGIFSGTWDGGTFEGKVAKKAASAGVATCASSHYSVPVHAPTITELAVYAKTYSGNVGSFGPNIGDPFVATGSAAFVLDAAGALTYNGTTKLVTSMCLEDTPTPGAPLYIEMQPSDHIDLFTDGGFTGVLANGGSTNVVRGGSCTSTCGSGSSVATPTVTGYTPSTGAVGSSVAITGTNLNAVTEVLFTGPSPSFAFVSGTIATKTPTSISATVPSSLAAGNYTVTVVHPGGEITVGPFTVAAAAGGGATGLTLSPAFNGLSTFANKTPTNNGGGTFVYSQGVGIPNVTVTYLDAVNTGSENITISVEPDFSGATAYLDQGAGFAAQMCILTAKAGVSAPVCSTVGVTFNRATGTVSFVNTPMKSVFGGTTTTFALNGSLTFTPF